jgi:hypothetical protein
VPPPADVIVENIELFVPPPPTVIGKAVAVIVTLFGELG